MKPDLTLVEKENSSPPTPPTARVALLTGGLAALLASTCCLGPLVLLALGFSGAWIGNLTALEPYRPLFITAALAALLLAWRRLWRPAGICAPGTLCAVPRISHVYRWLFGVVAALVLVTLVFPYLAPLLY
jgi:mercuric ion transport protein